MNRGASLHMVKPQSPREKTLKCYRPKSFQILAKIPLGCGGGDGGFLRDSSTFGGIRSSGVFPSGFGPFPLAGRLALTLNCFALDICLCMAFLASICSGVSCPGSGRNVDPGGVSVDSRGAGVDSGGAGVDPRGAGVDSRGAGVDPRGADLDSRGADVDWGGG